MERSDRFSIGSATGMTLAFVTTGLNHGGAETQLVNLAIRLRQRGHTVGVISMLPPVAFADELGECGIAVASLRMRRGVPDLRALGSLVKLLRQWKPDLVHAHQFHANLLSRIARVFTALPALVCTAHSVYEAHSGCVAPKEKTWRERAYRYSDPMCDLTTQICRAGLERYVRIKAAPARKLRCVPNGIDTSAFRPCISERAQLRRELRLDDTFAWLSVGRLDHVKDHRTLLTAYAQVRQRFPNTRLLLVGDGPLREQVVKWVAGLRLEQAVIMLGVRNDVAALMNAADAFVLSSFFEGLPLVLLEALASHLPVVATSVGGVPEIVSHESSGYLCAPGRPDELAAGMQRLMALPQGVLRNMGNSGRAHVVAQYDLAQIVHCWESIYQELAGRVERVSIQPETSIF